MPIPLLDGIKTSYPQAALLEVISLIGAARRGSRFDWQTAFDVLSEATSPIPIASHDLPAVAMLTSDREEIARAIHRAHHARPFLTDQWAVIPFSSACLIHDSVANASLHRLHEHYVVAANFGYRAGFVHLNIRTELPSDLLAEIADISPAYITAEWSPTCNGAISGALSRKDFLQLLNHMGFPLQQTMEIDRAGMRN